MRSSGQLFGPDGRRTDRNCWPTTGQPQENTRESRYFHAKIGQRVLSLDRNGCSLEAWEPQLLHQWARVSWVANSLVHSQPSLPWWGCQVACCFSAVIGAASETDWRGAFVFSLILDPFEIHGLVASA